MQVAVIEIIAHHPPGIGKLFFPFFDRVDDEVPAGQLDLALFRVDLLAVGIIDGDGCRCGS